MSGPWPVGKWGNRAVVTQEMIDKVGEENVRATLIRHAENGADRQGWLVLPDTGNVDFIRWDDPRFPVLDGPAGLPDGTVLAPWSRSTS